MSNQPESSFARPGKIATGTSFIGRQDEIEKLQARALPQNKDAAGNVAIVGLRSFGKTSLVYQAIMMQKEQLLARHVLPIWINIALYEDSQGFFCTLVKLCQNELLRLGWSTPVLETDASNAQEGELYYTYVKQYFLHLHDIGVHAIFILDKFDHAQNLFRTVRDWNALRDLVYEPFSAAKVVTLSLRSVAYIENINFINEHHKEKVVSSYFYAVLMEIPLKPFSDYDMQEYFRHLELAGIDVTPKLAERIDFYCGGHPHLLMMLGHSLVAIFREKKIIDIENAADDLRHFYIQYTAIIVNLLQEKNLFGKLLQILFGPVIDVAQEDIDELLRYGLIKINPHWIRDANPAYVAFSAYFQECLEPLIWQTDLVDWLSKTEQAVRHCITTQLQKQFAECWETNLIQTMPHLWGKGRERDQQLADVRGSYETGERLNFLNISELFEIITSDAYWGCFKPIFQNERSDKDQFQWSERAAFIAVLRVPLLYRSARDVASAGLLEIRMFCNTVLELIQEYEQEYENEKTLHVIASLRSLSHLDFTVDCLEQNLQQLHDLEIALPPDLEKQHIVQLRYILQESVALCQQNVFEHIERLCQGIIAQCEKLSLEIHMLETTPVTQAFGTILATISAKANQYLEYTYTHAAPLLTLKVLKDEHYYLHNGKQIEVQLALENADGCGPAKDIRLEVKSTVDLQVAYTQHPPRALSGGKQAYIVMLITQTKQANYSEELPLTISVAYSTRSSEEVLNQSFTPHLTRSFEDIANPYLRYVNAGAVDDPRMFWGRDALLKELVEELAEAKGRGIIIYGQKRSGKTSVLYHLRKTLEQNPDLLVLNIGSIGRFLYEDTLGDTKTVLLWPILKVFQKALKAREARSAHSSLDLTFPAHKEELDQHPERFLEVFEQFQSLASDHHDWKNVRIVILLDEFTYLYTLLVDGHPIDKFMQMWKACMQEELFSTVMVGQDVLPKFKKRCANEFHAIKGVRMDYISDDHSQGLIDVPIHISGQADESRYRGHAIASIIKLTAGNPFYIQIFCDRLVRYLNHKQTTQITEIDVNAVKDRLLHGDDALSWEDFDNLTNAGDNAPDAIHDDDARKVLQSIALKAGAGACPRNKIDCQTQADIDLILDDLKARGVINYAKEYGYDIRVKLFKEWLIANER